MEDEYCFLCQKPKSIINHITESCPNVKCRACGQKGHTIRTCPELDSKAFEKSIIPDLNETKKISEPPKKFRKTISEDDLKDFRTFSKLRRKTDINDNETGVNISQRAEMTLRHILGVLWQIFWFLPKTCKTRVYFYLHNRSKFNKVFLKKIWI